MAVKVMLRQRMLVAGIAIYLVACISLVNAEEFDLENILLHGQGIKAETNSSKLSKEKILWKLEKGEETPEPFWPEDNRVGRLLNFAGRQFLGINGLNDSSYSVSLSAFNGFLVTTILIGLAILIILLSIALATGKDLSYMKNFMNMNPYYDATYYPDTYDHDHYLEESTYESYEALEAAAKRYQTN